jgi:tRNA dimethylallyltransferase
LDKKTVIFIGGPTASGKTRLAIDLAKKLQCAIISGDSRQFYKGMAIGTAQPSAEELAEAPHHFIACNNPNEEINAGQFEQLALAKCNELFETCNYVICVGGSGLYLKALYEGFHAFPDIKDGIREQLIIEFESLGIEHLQKELQEKDPVRYGALDENNPQRLIRALEVIRSTGKTYTSFVDIEPKQRDFNIVKFQPEMDRPTLYNRINMRVDIMYKMGLLKEVELLKPYWNNNSLKTVGYSENISFFKGELILEQACELLKKNTRNFAKRQLTWFRKEGFETIQSVDDMVLKL